MAPGMAWRAPAPSRRSARLPPTPSSGNPSPMQRFTISLEEPLAEAFDAWIAERGYSNRSEAVRDLLRAELGRTLIDTARSLHCVAALSYVYNHHERDLGERLA